jgi:hypothetical protein
MTSERAEKMIELMKKAQDDLIIKRKNIWAKLVQFYSDLDLCTSYTILLYALDIPIEYHRMIDNMIVSPQYETMKFLSYEEVINKIKDIFPSCKQCFNTEPFTEELGSNIQFCRPIGDY